LTEGEDVTLIDDGKVVIEVGLNEMASKHDNPHVPYSWQEVARDTVACAEAGAGMVHFHARYDDGAQAKTDDGIYRSAMAEIAKSSNIITFPTSFPLGGNLWEADELQHHWALVEHPPEGAPLRVGAFDGFRIGPKPLYDVKSRRLFKRATDSLTFAQETYELPSAMAEMLRRGLLPSICCYDLGDVRWTRLVTAAGLLPQPVRAQFQLFASYVNGPSATTASIDAMVAEWATDGPLDAEIEVVPYGVADRETYEALLRHALERGLNIRVGLGDCPVAIPGATNSDLVEWAVRIVESYGLKPATTTEVRHRFGF
jgi:3-keto-5-aminohexanoate cleavage enzyme